MAIYSKFLCEDALDLMNRDPMALTGVHMEQLPIVGKSAEAIAAREAAVRSSVPTSAVVDTTVARKSSGISVRMIEAMAGEVVSFVKRSLTPRDEQLAALDSRIADLQSRIQTLEREPRLKYQGVHEKGRYYAEGDTVTAHGSMWVCRTYTDAEPGSGDGWTLAVKRGRDGRDAR